MPSSSSSAQGEDFYSLRLPTFNCSKQSALQQTSPRPQFAVKTSFKRKTPSNKIKRPNGGSPLNAPVAGTITGLVVPSASIGTALPRSHHLGPTLPTSHHGHRQARGRLPLLLLSQVYRQESYVDLQFPELLRRCQ
ncbi:hypothetical protein MRX96_009400 [Rhipicephalus microplus]